MKSKGEKAVRGLLLPQAERRSGTSRFFCRAARRLFLRSSTASVPPLVLPDSPQSSLTEWQTGIPPCYCSGHPVCKDPLPDVSVAGSTTLAHSSLFARWI